MKRVLLSLLSLAAALTFPFSVDETHAQNRIHTIEGRLTARERPVGALRIKLLRMPARATIFETFSRPEGHFVFRLLAKGEYAIETFDTEIFEASFTSVTIDPPHPDYPITVSVFVELPLRISDRVKPGIIAADVDLTVPKAAKKRYQKGIEALKRGDMALASAELRAAILIYPDYYAARLELGRGLRLRKEFQEAAEILNPLLRIAPRRSEPLVEVGIVLLELGRRDEAIERLQSALGIEEGSWAGHLYLGWALLEFNGEAAEPHFKRAIEIDEQKSARAHLALGRLAEERGQHRLALNHLDAYLKISPDANDAEAVRNLAVRLRARN